LQRLVGAEGAGGGVQPIQVIIAKRSGGGEKTVGDRSDVAIVVVTVGEILLVGRGLAVGDCGISVLCPRVSQMR
jgi:hypothetical protein